MLGRRPSDYGSQPSSLEKHGSTEKTPTVVEEEQPGGPPQPSTDMFKAQEMPRSDTPNTYLSEVADKPDITLFCDLCRIFIDIRLLRHHRAYHDALQLLGCKNQILPETTEILLKKRDAVLKKIKRDATKENPLQTKQVERVNNAYELLKSELEDTFEAYRKVKDTVDISSRATALSSSLDCVHAIGMCTSPNSRWKSEMEDTKIHQDCFGENKQKCYIGLFDGYHGRFTAEVAASLLHKMLLHELMKFDSSLLMHPKEMFNTDTDISHHTFVFGAKAKLDGQNERGDVSSNKSMKGREKDAGLHGETLVTMQLDDANLTQHIIELCEQKYEHLLEAISSSLSSENSSSRQGNTIDRNRHPDEKSIGRAFCKSYQLLDILLSYGKDEWSRVRWSGCSALTVLMESVSPPEDSMLEKESLPTEAGDSKPKLIKAPKTQGYIHLANSGDTRAVLVRGNRSYRLSKDHTPHNSKERDRIIKMGGKLTTSEVDSRVNGVLATTRGLGNHGDLGLKNCVLVEPHTCSIQIDQYAQFLVLATRGVWEIMSDQEVASLLLRQLPKYQIPAPSKPSSSLQGLMEGSNNTGDREKGSKSAFNPCPAAGTMDGGDYGTEEKGADDVDIAEKPANAEEAGLMKEALTIAADLKTEAGSHFGDDPDQDLECDMVTLPEHSNLQLGDPQSVEVRRRELAKRMAEHLVQAALLAGSHDNITVIVVLLPGCEV